MPKNTEDYEEQVRKEFEATQTVPESNESNGVVKNLGKVNFESGINDDPEIKRVKATMDYINIPLDTLPCGKFYPENTRISIRSAKVNEIREYSTIDEQDPRDIRDKMTYMLSQCCKVYYGNTPGYFKDIKEDDRVPLVLKIRELTFTDARGSIKIPVPEGACKTPGCHPQKTVDFSSDKLEYKKPSEKLEKYYDSSEKCYTIPTKRFGTFKLYIPTVGVTSIVADWITQQKNEDNKPEAAIVEILPFLIKDWRTFSEKQVFTKITEIAGFSTEKFVLLTRLIEEISVGIEYEITETCAQCGGELRIPVVFPDGFRSLFVPTISDLGDELL